MPQRTGRVPKLTPAVQTAICNAVQVGVPATQAAQLVGVGRSTVLLWLQRGDPHRSAWPKAIYTEFLDAVTRAKAIDEARRLARLEQAGRGGAVIHEKTTQYGDGRIVTEKSFAPPDWRCDAWYLEHAYPERWGRRVQADLQLRIDQMVQEVAAEIGVDPAALLAEAQAFLREHDARRR